MDFKIIKEADRDMLTREPLFYKWKGEEEMNDPRTCFGCQHSLNFGCPNIDSSTCMDFCRRGSCFKPFNGDPENDAIQEERKDIDTWFEEEKPEGPMSWAPQSGSQFMEPEGTVFKGISERHSLEGLSNIPVQKLQPGSIVDLGAHHPVKYKVVEEYDHDHEARPWPEPKNNIDIEAMNKANELADDLADALIGYDHPQSPHNKVDNGNMRTFETGATRDTAEGKLDYEGFLSLPALKQFAKYMNMNRLQSDGQIRKSDNWKAGFPMESYVKSGLRHDLDWIEYHQSDNRTPEMNNAGIAAVCGLIFNAMGYLDEWLKSGDMIDFDGDDPTAEMKERRDEIKKLSKAEDTQIDTGDVAVREIPD